MATKKEAGAPAPQEVNVWTIGNLKFRVPESQTSQKAVKMIAKSVLIRNNYDIKNTFITLPNGRKVLYKQLNNIKEFTKLLFPDVYLLPETSERKERLWQVMVTTAMKAGSRDISWNDVGNDNIKYGEELLTSTLEQLLAENAISEEEKMEFVEMIEMYKHHYIR